MIRKLCVLSTTLLIITGCSLKNDESLSKKNDLNSVYESVLQNKTVEPEKLGAVDYLKLYKKLKLNQPETFLKVKVSLIHKFMIEVKNNVDLEHNAIYLALLNEDMDKVDTLIYQLL